MRSAFVPGAAAAATVATRKAMTARARVMYFMSVSLGGYRRPQGETGVRVSSERSEDGAQRNRERRVEGADICARGRGKFIRQARDADAAKCWQMQILARSRTARNTLPYSHRAWRATPHSRRGFQSSERSGRDALDSQPRVRPRVSSLAPSRLQLTRALQLEFVSSGLPIALMS